MAKIYFPAGKASISPTLYWATSMARRVRLQVHIMCLDSRKLICYSINSILRTCEGARGISLNSNTCAECFFYILQLRCAFAGMGAVRIVHLLNKEFNEFRATAAVGYGIQTMHQQRVMRLRLSRIQRTTVKQNSLFNYIIDIGQILPCCKYSSTLMRCRPASISPADHWQHPSC